MAGDTKRPSGVNLDVPPPAPPSLSGPTADMGGIMGQGPQAQGSDAMQQTVATAMQAEQAISQLASTLPGFGPIAAQLVNVLRMGVARGLQQSQSAGPSPTPGAGMPSAPQPLQPPAGGQPAGAM